jgi:hypothetical protein
MLVVPLKMFPHVCFHPCVGNSPLAYLYLRGSLLETTSFGTGDFRKVRGILDKGGEHETWSTCRLIIVGVFDIEGVKESRIYVVGDESVRFPVRVFLFHRTVVVNGAIDVVLIDDFCVISQLWSKRAAGRVVGD